jgi:hypothetical protein
VRGSVFLGAALRAPLHDYARGLRTCVLAAGAIGVGAAVAGFFASWWIYVPLHELLHALGCWATGGRVWRLEIDALYGASLVRRVFPFVEVGSSYAGRLTGFDTGGSDLVFLATDFAPYVLTILIGVPLLRGNPRGPVAAALEGRRIRGRASPGLRAVSVARRGLLRDGIDRRDAPRGSRETRVRPEALAK